MRLAQLEQKYITESWNDPEMLLLEQKVIQPWVADLERMVAEATLTPDQINNLFTSIEQGATAAGGNRTAIGGLELKVLGGLKSGITNFIYPEENLKDFNLLYEKHLTLLKDCNFYKVNNIYEVIDLMLI